MQDVNKQIIYSTSYVTSASYRAIDQSDHGKQFTPLFLERGEGRHTAGLRPQVIDDVVDLTVTLESVSVFSFLYSCF